MSASMCQDIIDDLDAVVRAMINLTRVRQVGSSTSSTDSSAPPEKSTVTQPDRSRYGHSLLGIC